MRRNFPSQDIREKLWKVRTGPGTFCKYGGAGRSGLVLHLEQTLIWCPRHWENVQSQIYRFPGQSLAVLMPEGGGEAPESAFQCPLGLCIIYGGNPSPPPLPILLPSPLLSLLLPLPNTKVLKYFNNYLRSPFSLFAFSQQKKTTLSSLSSHSHSSGSHLYFQKRWGPLSLMYHTREMQPFRHLSPWSQQQASEPREAPG